MHSGLLVDFLASTWLVPSVTVSKDANQGDEASDLPQMRSGVYFGILMRTPRPGAAPCVQFLVPMSWPASLKTAVILPRTNICLTLLCIETDSLIRLLPRKATPCRELRPVCHTLDA